MHAYMGKDYVPHTMVPHDPAGLLQLQPAQCQYQCVPDSHCKSISYN